MWKLFLLAFVQGFILGMINLIYRTYSSQL